jgi:hypothetical protein
VIENTRLYIQRLFPDHAASLELLLATLKYDLTPNPGREDVEAHPGLVRDSKDIPVALAAIRAGADYLVGTDRDFTAIDESTAELRRYIKAMPAGLFPREVMGWTSKAFSVRPFESSTFPSNARTRIGRTTRVSAR